MTNTDLQDFVSLYKRFGISLKISETEEGFMIRMSKEAIDNETTESEKFEGYAGFCTDIHFDKQGQFVRQGFWE